MHDVGGVGESRKRRCAQETKKRPNGVDDSGSHPTGRLRTGRGAIAQFWDGLFGFWQTQGSMRAGEVVVSKPGKEQLLKMKRRACECLGLACEGSEIGAHGVINPFHECGGV